MSFDLLKIFHEMDWMARGVTFTLLVMAIAGLGAFIERLIAYRRSRRQSLRLANEAGPLVASGEYRKLEDRIAAYPASHLGRLLAPAIRIYLDYERRRGRGLSVVELCRRELARQHEDMGTDLRRGLGILASVGSVAPFVGLLGTVVGIIAAFTKISTTGSGGLSSVAGGISEALVVTALGLVVAIPAVLAFNFLSNRADRIHQRLGTSAGQFIDHLELMQQTPADAARGHLMDDLHTSDENHHHGDHAGVPAV